jgi:tetratricopeptide (TPR) repeat protein
MTLITGVVGLFVLLNQAEAERARLAEARRNAEAYEKFSASAADQFEVFLLTKLFTRPGAVQERLDAALSKLESAAMDLRGRGIVPSSALGILKAVIGLALIHRSKEEEARDPLNQAIADLKQCLAKNPEDKAARFWLLEALYWSGFLAEGAGQLEDALNLFEQAAAITTAIDPRDSLRAPPARIYKVLQRLADRLGQSGRTELERRSRHASQQVIRYLLEPGSESATDASPPGLEALRRLFERNDLWRTSSHEDKELRDAHEIFVAEWLAISVESLSPFRSSSSAATHDRDPEAGAAALIAAIRDRCSKLGLADSMVPAATRVFVDDAAGAASLQRRVGRLDEAHATVACLMALARQLVKDYPNDANSYDVLSHAHQQITKNAFKTNDDQLVQQSLVHAVEAVQRAVELRPEKTEYQRRLADLTQRLAGIRADRKPESSPAHRAHASGKSISDRPTNPYR